MQPLTYAVEILPAPSRPILEQSSPSKAFIEANTIITTLDEVRHEHLIPVFVKDNEPLISQSDFIGATVDAITDVFRGEHILYPQVRVSHPIKGRIPEAKNKPASQLQDSEKTLYYERMIFAVEIPSIQATVGGNTLSLTIGGIKAYNLDNLYNRKGADEHFKVFIGFQNKVCTNMCVWTDGYMSDLRVKNLDQLHMAIYMMLRAYNQDNLLHRVECLPNYTLSEQQFALLLGRCRMYQHLPSPAKLTIPTLLFGDTQLGAVCKEYYRDESFCREANGSINLWRLYNLFTGANKSSYIDTFLDRSVNALQFVEQVRAGLDGHSTNWYLQ
ncbi:DUF3871 family protein [Spirosoma pollinicola]|uniref:DUF3871 domain-containing protein n=1 Tax=Spirosoma pollinicola TaxID=2057025 RepID=A0A2K8Z468_9BACT|nr:DUF3871 family protein [Spirosoma pollinicola]AUD04660.1 hypothetical protein CWM47_24105 [Spirosoma pollinicola]